MPFEQLLTAFRMDQSIARYPTFGDLRCYISLVCEPLGQLLLYCFGYRERGARPASGSTAWPCGR